MPIVTFKPAEQVEQSWWRPIPSCPGYEACSDGRVRRIGALTTQTARPEGPLGYLKVGLYIAGKSRAKWLHRLICEAFYGPPAPPRVFTAHWNGIVSDCNQSNLRWATKAENEADKIRHGRTNRGERNGQAKITDAQAASLRDRVADLPKSSGGARVKKGAIAELSKDIGISSSAIRAIAAGRFRRNA